MHVGFLSAIVTILRPVGCLALIACVAVSASHLVPATATADDPIGYQRLLDAVGPSLESGVGVVVSQVEADLSPNDDTVFRYLPNESSAQFTGKTIIDGSGFSTSPSSHATGVGAVFYGNNSSIAFGVTEITGYDAIDWLGRVMGGNDNSVPLPQNFKVSNHAYVGSAQSDSEAENLLQRVDFTVNENQMTVVVGVNNGASNLLPQLLGQGYNSIAVGRSDGNHSHGFTTIYGEGRVKPDIVAPRPNTSQATAQVSSVATLLHEKAVNMGSADAARPEVMKAIIMAGATKEQFPSWNRTTTRPLDERFGAGQLNVFHSYMIMDAGQAPGSEGQPSDLVGPRGWDYQDSLEGGESLFYDLDARNIVRLDDVSMILTWNMQVENIGSPDQFDPQTSLADLSLRIYDSTNGFLDTLIDASLSPVDNVEHLYFESLGPGLYTVEVSNESGFASSFALAWRAQVIPEPSAGWLAFICIAWIAHRRRRV